METKLLLKEKRSWRQFAAESFLVLGSVLLLTIILLFSPFAPRIPDNLLLYLLAILVFACVYGLYAALLASFIAFFAFDYFFVPPVYSLGAAKFEDIFGLAIFLMVALISGRLASLLRIHALQARQREYEARTLYEFVRATNRENDVKRQLGVFVKAVVGVFSSGGICDCTLFLPDASGVLRPLGNVFPREDSLSLEEEVVADWVMLSARAIDLYDCLLPLATVESEASSVKKQPGAKKHSDRYIVRLVPLKTETKVLGVLRLLIGEREGQTIQNNTLGIELRSPAAQNVFFSTFLEQAVTVLEQSHLRDASIHLEVLQQTELLRSALFSSVSHDLRTPLATIKAAVSTLLQEDTQKGQEIQQSVATAIEREVDRLDGFVENVLDMSRIEAGSLHLEKVWYPLDELVSDAVNQKQAYLGERVIYRHFPSVLPPVELDAVQIEQVLNNLFENAIRYTPEGSPIDVSIRVRGKCLLVSIADRGPGVPLSEYTRIFDKFYRLSGNGSGVSHPRGLGLGLAICQGIINAHEGRIWVESREGGGAIFCFTLPFKEIGEDTIDE